MKVQKKLRYRSCPLCNGVFPLRGEGHLIQIEEQKCPFELGILQFSTGNPQFVETFKELLERYPELEVRNMVTRMWDATSLYVMRDPTDEEKETTSIPFNGDSLETFTNWIKYAYEEKKEYEWFALIKKVHDVSFDNRAERTRLLQLVEEAEEEANDVSLEIERTKRNQKGVNAAIEGITRAILQCSSEEKIGSLQEKLQQKTEENLEMEKALERLQRTEEYVKKLETRREYDKFSASSGITSALQAIENWRFMARDSQPHENLGEVFEDTTEYFVKQIARQIEVENELSQDSLIVIRGLQFEKVSVPPKSCGEFDFCICKPLEIPEYPNHVEILKIIECKNNALSVSGDIKKKIESMKFFNGLVENSKSLYFTVGYFTVGGTTYSFTPRSFQNLKDDKFFNNIIYFTRPGFLLKYNFYDIFYQAILDNTNTEFMSDEFIAKTYHNFLEDSTDLASATDGVSCLDKTLCLIENQGVKILEPLVPYTTLDLPEEVQVTLQNYPVNK